MNTTQMLALQDLDLDLVLSLITVFSQYCDTIVLFIPLYFAYQNIASIYK